MDCEQMNDCATRLPSEDNKWLNFKNHYRKECVPFVVYADLECILEKTETEETSKYQYHRVFATRIFQIISKKFQSIDTKRHFSVRVHWLRRKVRGHMFTAAQIVLLLRWQAISYPRIIMRTLSTCGSGSLFESLASIAIYI